MFVFLNFTKKNRSNGDCQTNQLIQKRQKNTKVFKNVCLFVFLLFIPFCFCVLKKSIDPVKRANTKCKIFLGYTSNLVSSGLRETIRFLVQHKMVKSKYRQNIDNFKS